ncbi:unnamed protein product [Phytophthora fragariaefolia]|uniref:Unnamed protein product n=1 Tax=Phytophthora fragariaefolia TaxID=1490495 RepID=A0A9W6X4X2_9STRA|nr:unnamed protein product [Phytophthora fragariaefolia]
MPRNMKNLDVKSSESIVHTHSSPTHTLRNTPQQNGVVGRRMRTIMERVRALLLDDKLPKQLWAECICHVTTLINMNHSSKTNVRTPYELWYNRIPSMQYMKMFGCSAYVHITEQYRDKLDAPARLCMYLAVSDHKKGYGLMDLNSHAIIYSRDAMSSDSDSTDEGEARPQPNWCKICRSTASGALDMFRSTISKHGIHKSDTTNCSIDHLFDRDYQLATSVHEMRVQLAKCRSTRCRSAGNVHFQSGDIYYTVCPCRYKFKICLSSGTTEAFQYDRHIVDTSGSISPSDKTLTPAMKDFIIQQLSSGVKTTAVRLFAVICGMVQAGDMEGPLPKDQQVTDFVKTWRRKNPKDQMAPMVEICDGYLYEQQNLSTLSDSAMLIPCDSQPDSRPGSDHMVSHLGDGSTAFPFRVGMTCLRQIQDYIAVQGRNDCTTILYVDSTHSMVIHGYSVFAFGYSDQSCHFLPLWVETQRFAKWQAFYTPRGYAATNNPLEQIAENELVIQSRIEESICNDSLDLQSLNPTFAYQGDRGSPVVEDSAAPYELPLTGSVRDYQSLPTGEHEPAGHQPGTSESALRRSHRERKVTRRAREARLQHPKR